eukprot:COSAG03_NODE_16271_length_406_cov_11.052117_1_plen_80_part_10
MPDFNTSETHQQNATVGHIDAYGNSILVCGDSTGTTIPERTTLRAPFPTASSSIDTPEGFLTVYSAAARQAAVVVRNDRE